MISRWAIALSVFAAAAPVTAQAPAGAAPRDPLHRDYREAEKLGYRMTGQNEAWHYTIRADGIVTKNAAGVFAEEYRWHDMMSDGKPLELSPATLAFRQRVSLDPITVPSMPDLGKVDRSIIGPITDMMTFYSDEWLVVRMGALKKPGDHFYFPMPFNPSWADGKHVLAGEDSIAFDMTWKSTGEANHAALILVRHIPPARPTVHLAADWMKTPVADTPNNWVEVEATDDGKFEAAVGKETFDVELTIDLADGKILAGRMDNTVKTIHRLCEDRELTRCGNAGPHEIERKIEIALADSQ